MNLPKMNKTENSIILAWEPRHCALFTWFTLCGREVDGSPHAGTNIHRPKLRAFGYISWAGLEKLMDYNGLGVSKYTTRRDYTHTWLGIGTEWRQFVTSRWQNISCVFHSLIIITCSVFIKKIITCSVLAIIIIICIYISVTRVKLKVYLYKW